MSGGTSKADAWALSSGRQRTVVARTFLDFLGAPSLAALKEGRHAGRSLEIDGRRWEQATRHRVRFD